QSIDNREMLRNDRERIAQQLEPPAAVHRGLFHWAVLVTQKALSIPDRLLIHLRRYRRQPTGIELDANGESPEIKAARLDLGEVFNVLAQEGPGVLLLLKQLACLVCQKSHQSLSPGACSLRAAAARRIIPVTCSLALIGMS